jgi:cysteinyl-tRNA synthetase
LASTVNSIKNQQIPRSSLTEETLSRLKLEFPKILEDILGLKLSSEAKSDHLDGVLELMIRMRNQARADRNFALADQIRDQLKDAGVELKDGKNGTEYELN